jgi:hypothetical protein
MAWRIFALSRLSSVRSIVIRSSCSRARVSLLFLRQARILIWVMARVTASAVSGYDLSMWECSHAFVSRARILMPFL